jgi:uroporphyrinogen decarboxylase
MTHRERLNAALNHEETDRVPMDLGSTRVTSITVPAYERLKRHFGVEEDNIITDKMQQTVRVNEKILTALDIDTRLVLPSPPDLSRDATLPDGSWRDEWGVVRRKPLDGYYYDLLESPLAGEPTREDLEEYPWPDPDDPGRYRGLREYARRLREETDYAVVGHMSGGWIHTSQYLRGFEGWYIDLIERPLFIGELMERVRDINLRITERFLDEVGDYLDVVATGDDIGAQSGPIVSPKVYREMIWPLQKGQFSFVREHTKAKIFYHTCGSVYLLLPDIIDMGVNILNPVQVSAEGMGDTKRLKREFGKHLSFWGGVDTFYVMPRGTPGEVKEEAERRIGDLGEGGGYVLNTVHNIQPDVPVENILALYEAGREFRRS